MCTGVWGRAGIWGNRGKYVRHICSQHALDNFHLHEEVNDGGPAGFVRRERVHSLIGTTVGFRLGFLSRHPSLGQTRRKDSPPLLAEFIPYEVGGMWVEFRACLLRLLSLDSRMQCNGVGV